VGLEIPARGFGNRPSTVILGPWLIQVRRLHTHFRCFGRSETHRRFLLRSHLIYPGLVHRRQAAILNVINGNLPLAGLDVQRLLICRKENRYAGSQTSNHKYPFSHAPEFCLFCRLCFSVCSNSPCHRNRQCLQLIFISRIQLNEVTGFAFQHVNGAP
jgi:hypothetical protein